MSDVFFQSLLVCVAAFATTWLAIARGWIRLAGDSELQHTVLRLTRELDQERALRRQLEERVDFLVDELKRAGFQIRDLEDQLSKRPAPPSRQQESVSPLAKPLLLICGNDPAMCDKDRQSLLRAGIPFQRIYNATKRSVADELRRRRQSETLYPWLHITAHASPEGILLADGVAEPDWWSDNLIGIQVVFLAACQTAAVADALAGLCTVVFVHEDIGDRDATAFAYAFWRRIAAGDDAMAAYRQAILEAPQVAEFTDIRRS